LKHSFEESLRRVPANQHQHRERIQPLLREKLCEKLGRIGLLMCIKHEGEHDRRYH
jgi:hypothetical protein